MRARDGRQRRYARQRDRRDPSHEHEYLHEMKTKGGHSYAQAMFGRIQVPRRRLVVMVLLVCILQGAQAFAANTTYAPTMSPSSRSAETNESGLTGNNDSQEVLDSEPFDDDSGQEGASSNGKDINEVTAQSPSTSAGEDSASHVGGILGGLAAGVFVLLVGVAYVAVPRVRSRQQDTYDQHQLAAGSGSRSKLRFFENPHDDAGDDLEDNSTLAPKFHQDSVHRHPPSSFAKPSSAPPIISRALAEAEIEIEAEAKARAKAETGARGSRRFVQSLRLAFGLSRSSSSNTKSSSSRFNFLSPDVAVDEEATKPREDLGTFGAPSPRAASGWGRRGFDDDHVQDYDDDNDDDDAAFAGPKMLGSSRRVARHHSGKSLRAPEVPAAKTKPVHLVRALDRQKNASRGAPGHRSAANTYGAHACEEDEEDEEQGSPARARDSMASWKARWNDTLMQAARNSSNSHHS